MSVDWTEVSDFGDIFNLHAAMDYAAGDRMERFVIDENQDCKLYKMLYRIGDAWLHTTFRRAKMLNIFEVNTIEIVCGKWISTKTSEQVHTKIIEFLANRNG